MPGGKEPYICPKNDPRRPNFVILFLDDTGWGDIGANWNTSASPSETPHINALAAGGLRFTDFHAGASVCTPSRAALLCARPPRSAGACAHTRTRHNCRTSIAPRRTAVTVRPRALRLLIGMQRAPLEQFVRSHALGGGSCLAAEAACHACHKTTAEFGNTESA